MRLTAPSFPVFVISVVMAALVLVARYGGVTIPLVSANPFEVLLAAYAILFLGNVLRSF